ncbi:MAG: type II toxin-antitoxin system HicA family toxin [Oscillospiraceae bacterium]|nr:type II toxin-antitoxin system HicA family toxin [Oscillospiraceae bacterium]
MNKRKFLEKICNNNKNVNFYDLVAIIEAFGFFQIRTKGSHHIFARDGVYDLVNIQNEKGEVKPYQVTQFLKIIEKFNLELED